MSLDHKIDPARSGAPSVRTDDDMIIIYDNPEKLTKGVSELYFHGHTLVRLNPGFYQEEQVSNESALVLKDLEFAFQLLDECTRKKFQNNHRGEIVALSSEEVEDKMEIIIQAIFPALELVKNDLEKKIKQNKRFILSMEAQKQDASDKTRELDEFEKKLLRIAPLFGSEDLNFIRENIKQNEIQLIKENNPRKKRELSEALTFLETQLKNRLIDHYIVLSNNELECVQKLPTLVCELESQMRELLRSKNQKVKELQKQVAKHSTMIGLPYTDSSTHFLANLRYEEAFIPVEISVGQNLYLSTWTSGSNKTKISSLKEMLPKQIITANCMLSGSLEGVTRKGVRFQLIDHNLDVCLTDASGSKIVDIIHDPHLSPYEVSMFVQFEHELIWMNNLYKDQPKPLVRYHLPGPDYMLSGLRYALTSDITLQELAKYCKAVKERMEAHQHAIMEIASNAGVPVTIESPLDNLGDMYTFMSKNFGSVVFPSLDGIDMINPEEKFVDIILQTLRNNNPGSLHQRAWAAVLPENIVAARQDPIWRARLPKTIKELLYLANSMEFAFASIAAADAGSREDFNVLALHSTDESARAKNCIDPKFNLVEKFGHFMAVFVQPRELYDGGAKSNNPFRMDLATANAVREEFLAEVIRKRNPSEVLKSIIRANIHQVKEPHQPVQKKPDAHLTPVLDKPTAIDINPGTPGGSGMFAARPSENQSPAATPETSFQPVRPTTPAIYAQ